MHLPVNSLLCDRTYSGNIRQHTRASSRHYAQTLTSSTNPKPRHRSSGSLASTRRRSTTPTNCLVFSLIHSQKSRILCVLASSVEKSGVLSLTLFIAGATANVDSCRKALPSEARELARAGAEGAQHCDERLRFARCSRPRIHLLAVTVYRSWCCQGKPSIHRVKGYRLTVACVGRCLISAPTYHPSPNNSFDRATGGASRRDPFACECIPQTGRDVRWPGAHWSRFHATTKRKRVRTQVSQFPDRR